MDSRNIASPQRGRFLRGVSGVALVLARAAAISLPLVVLLAGLAWREYRIERDLVRDQLFTEAENALAVQARSMETQIMAVVRDAVFLADIAPLRRMLDSGTPEDREALAGQFLNAVARKGYDQVRYIDDQGLERVRVQLRLAVPTITPDPELQDETGEYYITAGLALARNEVYVSPLDLNEEHGQIVLPFKPTYRVCTPVYDSRGKRRGILVINVRAREMMDGLDAGSNREERQIMLLDSGGYWLKAPDPGDEWGFMFADRRDLTFARRNPEAWAALDRAETGRVEADDGLYATRLVRIAPSGSEAGPGVWVFQGQLPGREGPPELRLVARIPREHLELRQTGLAGGTALALGWAAAVVFLVALVLALVLERRKADKHQLQALNDRLQFQNLLMNAFSEASPDAIVVVDQADRALYHNARFLETWGFAPGDLDIAPCSEVLARVLPLLEDPEGFVRRMEELNSDPSRKDFSEIRLRDGRTLERQSVGLFGEDGGFLGRAWFYRDVTERARAAEALAAGEARLRLFVRHTPAAVAMFDTDMRYIVSSRRWNEDYGLGERDLTGLSHYAVFPEISREWRDIHRRILAGEIMRRAEDPFPRADGRVDWVRWENVPWRRDDGSIGGIVMFTEVVTERREAREALRESRARLAAVLDTAVDGIVTIDTRGIIQTVNPAVERIFGWNREEMEGGPVTRLMAEPHASRHDGYLRRYLESGAPRILGQGGREVPGRRKDGSGVPLELAVSEVRVGETRLFTGILRDITERKQAQERLMTAKAELEARQMRLDEDLVAAGEIQKSLLPRQLPVLGGELEIDWLFEPSQRIGGDIFDIFALDRDRVAAYVLDVSGHGVPSALVTVSVSQALQPGAGIVTQGAPGGLAEIVPPARVLERLNRDFPMERFDKFFTMVYLVLNHRTGAVEYSNAGHPPPLVVRADGGLERMEAGGMLVGMGELAGYVGGAVQLDPGDMLLLYTDGVTEYADENQEFFGEERLDLVARRMAGRHPDEALDLLWGSLMRFGRGAEPGDDVSVVCIRRCDR